MTTISATIDTVVMPSMGIRRSIRRGAGGGSFDVAVRRRYMWPSKAVKYNSPDASIPNDEMRRLVDATLILMGGGEDETFKAQIIPVT